MHSHVFCIPLAGLAPNHGEFAVPGGTEVTRGTEKAYKLTRTTIQAITCQAAVKPLSRASYYAAHRDNGRIQTQRTIINHIKTTRE